MVETDAKLNLGDKFNVLLIFSVVSKVTLRGVIHLTVAPIISTPAMKVRVLLMMVYWGKLGSGAMMLEAVICPHSNVLLSETVILSSGHSPVKTVPLHTNLIEEVHEYSTL